MAYASNTDVILEFKGLAAVGWNTQTVTAATVDEWCTQASNIIDTAIGGKYQVPVNSGTSPNSFSVLKNLCIQLVKPRVQNVLKSGTGDNASASKAGTEADPTKGVMDFLKQVASGDVKLSDAVLATTQDGVESYTNDNADTLQPPTFNRHTDEW